VHLRKGDTKEESKLTFYIYLKSYLENSILTLVVLGLKYGVTRSKRFRVIDLVTHCAFSEFNIACVNHTVNLKLILYLQTLTE
jgi:hypothetical protein